MISRDGRPTLRHPPTTPRESPGHAPHAPQPRPEFSCHDPSRPQHRPDTSTSTSTCTSTSTSTSREEQRAVVAAAVTTGTAVGVVGLAAAPAGASRPASAQTEYLAAINAVGDQGVHYASHAKQGSESFSVSGDTGVKSGTQTLTLKEGSSLEHLTVVSVGSTGYVNANSTALKDVIGLPAATAKKYAGKWISFDPTSAQYSELVAGLLDSQVAGELKMSGPFHYGATKTIDGKSAFAVVGSVSDNSGNTVSATLWVPTSGSPLPIEQTTAASSKGAIAGTVTFTKWGQKVAQKAPAHATAASKLVPATAPGSTTTTG